MPGWSWASVLWVFLFFDDDAFDRYGLFRTIVRTSWSVHDFVDHSHSLGHFPEDRMFAVQPGRWFEGDEELGTIGAGTCVGHREDSGTVKAVARGSLVPELITRAPHAGSRGVAALDHEVRNHAVKNGPVIKWAPFDFLAGLRVGPFLLAGGEPDEVLDGFGGFVREELDGDVTRGRLDDRGVGRGFFSGFCRQCGGGDGGASQCQEK